MGIDYHFKKICFVIPSLGFGGAERVVCLLANYYSKNDADVSIITLNQKDKKCAYSLDKKIKVHNIYTDSNPIILRTIKRYNKLRSNVKLIRPDIVISFCSGANTTTLVSLLNAKIPIIISERNNPKTDPKNIWKRIIRDRLYSLAQGWVFQTKEAKKYFKKSIRDNSVTIFNPIDINKIPSRNIKEETCNIVAVGRLEEQKNYPMLIDSFDKISNKYTKYNLLIYGEGSLRNALQNMINSKGLENRITLKGVVNNIPEMINNACLYIMTSNFEGMPNALIEAMAIGLPCISTDCPCGGPAELIQHGHNGLLVPVGDVEGLALSISKILDNKEMADKLGENAELIKNKLDVERISQEWTEYINFIVNRN